MTSTSAFSSLLSFLSQFTTSPSVLSFSLFPVFSFSSLSPNMAAQGSSTRWCPTTEQVMILEEMYGAGIRNPNASQIQQITAHLSTFGKIEGKNVFYWFQNHKARDRQKLRRKLLRQQQQQQLQYHYSEQQQQPTIETSSFSTPHQNPPSFLCPGCVEEAAQVMNFICKLDTLEMKDSEKSTMMYQHDWMVMMDVGSAPCYRPLKTLELFPINSTGIKEESNKTNHFQCPNSTN